MRELARLRMCDLDEEVSGSELLLGGELRHGEHRRKTDALFLSGAPQILDFPSLHPLIQVRLDDVLVFRACKLVFKNLPTRPLRVPHHIDQP